MCGHGSLRIVAVGRETFVDDLLSDIGWKGVGTAEGVTLGLRLNIAGLTVAAELADPVTKWHGGVVAIPGPLKSCMLLILSVAMFRVGRLGPLLMSPISPPAVVTLGPAG